MRNKACKIGDGDEFEPVKHKITISIPFWLIAKLYKKVVSLFKKNKGGRASNLPLILLNERKISNNFFIP